MGVGQTMRTIDINSEALNKCFGFKITTTFSNDSFAKKLLNGIDFENKVDVIKSLSRTLVLMNPDLKVLSRIKPGTVFCFDVDVVCESGNLKVIERVSRWLLKYTRCIMLHHYAAQSRLKCGGRSFVLELTMTSHKITRRLILPIIKGFLK